ncbi:Putative transferase [Septoria linicola]|uniref:Transferase n=1 Tax=Septoria linicola TaxID=215465 RepID=A0A9Q9EH75_9PEZI|nr:Putative transferase [Septoria linicola]
MLGSTYKVYPSETIIARTIKLSICDAYSPKVWVTQVHFWPLADPDKFQRAYDILKLGLGRTLTEIPALAGTICHLSDDPRDLGIHIDHDPHVEFAFKDLSDSNHIPRYADLKANGFPLAGLVEPLSQPAMLSPVHEGSRMITAQLSRLDGGLALSFGVNHVLADATSIAEIERIWSLHTADVSNHVTSTHRPGMDEMASRTRLSLPVSQPPTGSNYQKAALTLLDDAKRAMQASCGGDAEEIKMCLWTFSSSSLAKLKSVAAGCDASQWISTMDALVGLFWSRLAVVKQKSTNEAESVLLFPMNIRQRLHPSIDAHYIGNAIDIITTSCPLLALKADSGLVTAARQIRRANTGWQETKWASWLAMASDLPNDQAIVPNPLCLLATHNMAFNDYSKSLSNVLDWGIELGVIDRTRYMHLEPASNFANCATAVFVNPRLTDGSLEVVMTATEHLNGMLAADEVFSKYGRFVTVWS